MVAGQESEMWRKSMRRLLWDLRLTRPSGFGWKKLRAFIQCERGVLTVELVAIALILAVGAIAVTGVIFQGLAKPACGVVKQLDTTATCGG